MMATQSPDCDLTELHGDLKADWITRFHEWLCCDEGYTAFFAKNVIEAAGWRTILFDGVFYDYPLRTFATALAAACKKFALAEAVACNLAYHRVYHLHLSAVALNAVSRTLYGPTYGVIEARQRFALVTDGDYYWALAGAGDFVDAVVAEIGPEKRTRAECLDEVRELVACFESSDWPERRRIAINLRKYLEQCGPSNNPDG